jgi:nucleoside-diphosphate-sugar epimerase
MGQKKVLLTGILGLIGRNLAERLGREGFAVTGMVRPGSDPYRVKPFANGVAVNLVEGDLADTRALARCLSRDTWDVIFHVGALRGGRKASREEYYRVNVEATEVIGRHAQAAGAKVIFCSSVGVYGAIPRTLPARVDSPWHDDNYYHFTKIEAEKRLQELVSAGLDCKILRPSITYGPWDYGFPYALVRLVDKGMFLLPARPGMIHLADVDVVCDAFIAAARQRLPPGSVYNVADLEPVGMKALVDFICLQLKGARYPDWKQLPSMVFRLGERMAALLKNELWRARFELISRSWFYDVEAVKTELGIAQPRTIPSFAKVISWYRFLQG